MKKYIKIFLMLSLSFLSFELVFAEEDSKMQGQSLDTKSIRWETSFKLTDTQNAVLEDFAGREIARFYSYSDGVIVFDEKGLIPNTTYWRRIKILGNEEDVYLTDIGSATTLQSRPYALSLRRVGRDSLSVSVTQSEEWDSYLLNYYFLDDAVSNSETVSLPTRAPAFLEQSGVSLDSFKSLENLSLPDSNTNNQTAYFFKNITTAQNSGWITELDYTFTGLEQDKDYEILVKSRNADGIETEFSKALLAKTLKDDISVLELVLIPSVIAENSNEDANVLFPGDLIKYSVYYRNVGTQSSKDTFIIARIPGNYSGGMVLNNNSLSDRKDTDEGDFGKTRFDSVFVDLGDIEPQKGGKFEFFYKLPEDMDYPSLLSAQVSLGCAGCYYISQSSSVSQISMLSIRDEIFSKDLLEISSLYDYKSGLKNMIYSDSFVPGGANFWGGGGSSLMMTDTSWSNESVLSFAYSRAQEFKIISLNKNIFLGSLLEEGKERKDYFDEKSSVWWKIFESELILKNDIKNFLAEGGEQKKISPLEITGQVRASNNKLIVSGSAGEPGVEIIVTINNTEITTVKSLKEGFWEVEIPYKDLSSLKGVKFRFVVSIIALRPWLSKDHKYYNSGNIDLGKIDVFLDNNSYEEDSKVNVESGDFKEADGKSLDKFQETSPQEVTPTFDMKIMVLLPMVLAGIVILLILYISLIR